MLSINGLSYFIGSDPLLENTSVQVNDGEKIGLVGLNGSGKTTLLKIIAGQITPDSGNIIKSNDCTIGYLNQDLLSIESELPIIEIVMEAFLDVINLEHQITQLTEKMTWDHDPKLVTQLADLQDQYEIHEGYSIHAKAQEILEGIGFSTDQLNRPLNEFSGGWRMRVMLAKILLEKPKLLLLDEPTNHLDMPSIQWIEGYLRDYKDSVIIVSHDQLFLDNIIDKTIEISSRKLNLYAGNYSFYRKEKELRTEIQRNSYQNQQKKIRDTEKFIEKFRAKATKARQVQSRIKALDRMELIDEVVNETSSIDFHFKQAITPGRQIMQLKTVSKEYGPLKIFNGTDAFIERGDKIGMIGANGKGKSTFLRILAGTESFEGDRINGHNVIMSFYAQHQLESLDLNNDIITELMQSGANRTENELRTLLGCFLFSGEDIYKKIKVLSGGEKARVALAKTIISESNFLLLDEPTNHLDFFSIGILRNSLQEYKGTYVLVSHDRQFIEDTCNKIWYIEDHKIKEYPGKLSEYLYSQSLKKSSQSPAVIRKNSKTKSKSNSDYKQQKELKKKLSALKKTIKEIDEIINGLNEKKNQIERDLEEVAVYSDPDRLARTLSELEITDRQIEENQVRWMEAYNELEKNTSGDF